MTKGLASKTINKIIEASSHLLIDGNDAIENKNRFNSFVEYFFGHIPFRRLRNLKKNFGYNTLKILPIQAWNLVSGSTPNKPIVDLFHVKKTSKNSYTFVTIINHDRPFLVDTVRLVCRRVGVLISDIIHPVMPLSVVSGVDSQEDVSIISVIIEDTLSPLQAQQLQDSLEESLQDLYLATGDYTKVLNLANHAISLYENSPVDDLQNRNVVINFARWLFQDRLTILGARVISEHSAENLGIFKKEYYQKHCEFKSFYSNQIGKRPTVLYSLEKVSLRAIIHHYAKVAVFEIPKVNQQGIVEGSYQFIGIFNRLFYRENPPNIPILSEKIHRIYQQYHLKPEWHNAKEIQLILSSVPNDELLLLDESILYKLCSDLLFSGEHIALLVRPDPQGRTTTLQIFIPKDWYSYELPIKIIHYLSSHYGLTVNNHTVQLGELPYARLIIIASTDNLSSPLKIEKLREPITKIVMNWEEKLSQLLDHCDKFPHIKVNGIFPIAYQANFTPQVAIDDIHIFEILIKEPQTVFNLFLNDDLLFIKVFQLGHAISLSDIMPMLENFGLYVESESSYLVHYEGNAIWIHDITCKKPKNFDNLEILQQALLDVWSHKIENDLFNQFVILSGLTAFQCNVLRALNKALVQFNFSYSPAYIVEVLSLYPDLTHCLWKLFDERFSPNYSIASRSIIGDKLTKSLQSVKHGDHDKILSRFINGIQSIVRTNFYQQSSDQYLSFKFDSQKLEGIPTPKPLFEIFVYASYMEGCHLRGGKIARGGIRWSDRPEDFRSEVLGLMKAQMVKNSIIVPVGSKGGFVCKNYQQLKKQGSSQEVLQGEVIRCYETLIKGMLDLTDNVVSQKVQKPFDTICYDEDDLYLVVAADKGTSTFSDIANRLSCERGFWLGDAFASGGSKGYDHKKMAITSRGAWISVCHHFKQLGVDPQVDSISVVGIGDMSGDVFGNGMLRSHAIKLVAAFNHMSIFIDPNPDPQKSFNERLRLFKTPGSTWDHYDRKLISQGGGIYNRTDKTIPISPEIRKILDLAETTTDLSPDNLIAAILKSPVDLIWFGGIGTYVKSQAESHADARDRQNDQVRINANQLRCRVIGEGANLAMTQQARIEYALQGGNINTDAIDNSAGVDCSDHEVNIKILFTQIIEKNKLNLQQRDTYLEAMTDEVAKLVLEDNIQQNEILTLIQRESLQAHTSYNNLIHILENDPFMPLDRDIEFIPDDQEIEQRITLGKGLSRPELAVLLAYSKNILSSQLAQSLTGDEFPSLLLDYFPQTIQKDFKEFILSHPLKREILATMMSNLMVNKLGPSFVFETAGILGIHPSNVTLNFFIIRELLKTSSMWDDIKGNTHGLRYTTLICSIALRNFGTQEDFRQSFSKAQKLIVHLSTDDFSPIILAALFKIAQHDRAMDSKLAHNLIKVTCELGFNQISRCLESYHDLKEPWQREIFSNLQTKLVDVLAKLTIRITEIGDFNLWHKDYVMQVSQLRCNITTLETNASGREKTDLSYIMYVTEQIASLTH